MTPTVKRSVTPYCRDTRRSINSSLTETMLSPILAKPAGSPKADSSWRKPGKTLLSSEVLKSMATSSRSPSGLNRFVVGKYNLLSASILNTPLGKTSASPAQEIPLSHGAKNHRHRLPTRTRFLIVAPLDLLALLIGPASPPFWIVAQGTQTRWSRHRRQRAGRFFRRSFPDLFATVSSKIETCHGLGNEIRPWRSLVDAIRCPALRGYPGLS